MTKSQRANLALFLLLGLAASPAAGGEVRGRVRVLGRAERANIATLVFAESLESRVPITPGHYKMAQRNKTFVPHILAVPVGSTIDFPNEDLIFHNVFSRSWPGPFDLGLYRAGASKSHVFRQPAIYRLFCNIHPQMGAVILVLPTPFITETAASGSYQLDLPPGRYRVTAWSEHSDAVATEVTVSLNAVAVSDLTLDERAFTELPHKNKYGQDYPKSAYDPVRPKQTELR